MYLSCQFPYLEITVVFSLKAEGLNEIIHVKACLLTTVPGRNGNLLLTTAIDVIALCYNSNGNVFKLYLSNV